MRVWWARCSGPFGAAAGAGALILALGCTGEQRSGAGVSEGAGGPEVVQTEQNRERILQALTSGGPSGAAEQSGIRFRELGRESGFEFVRYDDMRGQRRILEVNGGGAAVFDVDGDGWLDVFLTNGCVLPTRLDRGQTPGRLFRNLRTRRRISKNMPVTDAFLNSSSIRYSCSAGINTRLPHGDCGVCMSRTAGACLDNHNSARHRRQTQP